MSLEALLAGIRANPDDLAARLILADWLEEHGGADLADLLRLQLRRTRLLASLREAGVEPADWQLTTKQEKQLLDAHESRWLGDVPAANDLRYCLIGSDFSAGLPQLKCLPTCLSRFHPAWNDACGKAGSKL